MLVILTVGMLAGVSLAQAGETQFFNMNGSKVKVVWSGKAGSGSFKAYYVTPRSAVVNEGAKPGAFLMSGSIASGKVNATPQAFKKGCKPAAYKITGSFKNGKFVLTGRSPIRSEDCKVTGGRSTTLRLVPQ